jgi:hypothetical protein
MSAAEQTVDGGLAVAIATYEFGTERVEMFVALAAIIGDASLERRELVVEVLDLVGRQRLEPAEPMLGADDIELIAEVVVVEVFDWAGWARWATGEMARQHDPQLARQILGRLTALPPVGLGANEVEASLSDAPYVRHQVVLVLQLVTRLTQLIER